MPEVNVRRRSATILIAVLVLVGFGCARLPYTTTVVHEDQRVAVRLQRKSSRPDMRIRSRLLRSRWRLYSAVFLCASNRACPSAGLPKKPLRIRSSAKTNYRY